MTEPTGWVGCLGCYNNGNLNGEWMTADEAEDIPDNCPKCGSDEFDVFDTDGGLPHPGGHYYSVPSFIADARTIEEADNPEALKAFAAITGLSLTEAGEQFEEAFIGEYESFEDYVQEMAETCVEGYGDGSDLAQFFDLEAYGRHIADGINKVRLGGTGSLFLFR